MQMPWLANLDASLSRGVQSSINAKWKDQATCGSTSMLASPEGSPSPTLCSASSIGGKLASSDTPPLSLIGSASIDRSSATFGEPVKVSVGGESLFNGSTTGASTAAKIWIV